MISKNFLRSISNNREESLRFFKVFFRVFVIQSLLLLTPQLFP